MARSSITLLLFLLPEYIAGLSWMACAEEVATALRNGSVSTDDNSIFYSGSTVKDPILTLHGWDTYCGSWYYDFGDGAFHLTSWMLPALIILSNTKFSPINTGGFKASLHLFGDPIHYTRAVFERLTAGNKWLKKAEFLWTCTLPSTRLEASPEQRAFLLQALGVTLHNIDQQLSGEQDPIEILRRVSCEVDGVGLQDFVLETAATYIRYNSWNLQNIFQLCLYICLFIFNLLPNVLLRPHRYISMGFFLSTFFISPAILGNITGAAPPLYQPHRIFEKALLNSLELSSLATHDPQSYTAAEYPSIISTKSSRYSKALKNARNRPDRASRQVGEIWSLSYPWKQARLRLFLQAFLPLSISLLCALSWTWSHSRIDDSFQLLIVAMVGILYLCSYILTRTIRKRALLRVSLAREVLALTIKDVIVSALFWLLVFLYDNGAQLRSFYWKRRDHISLPPSYSYTLTASHILFYFGLSFQLSVVGFWIWNSRTLWLTHVEPFYDSRSWREADFLAQQFEALRQTLIIEEDTNSKPFASATSQILNTQVNGDSEKNIAWFVKQSDRLSISDRVKNYIQTFASMPIIWWPLSDPQRPFEQAKMRIAWQCSSCAIQYSFDLAETAKVLSHESSIKQSAAQSLSVKVDSNFDSDSLLLLGRDETFDEEERDETMSQCSTLVGSDAPDVVPGTWQQKLAEYCEAQGLPLPYYILASDRRGGRTAWSCTIDMNGQTIPARYWYDGQYVHNAKEDAANVALERLNALKQITRRKTHGQPEVSSGSDAANDRGSPDHSSSSSLSTSTSNSASGNSFSNSQSSQRTQRVYPTGHVDTLLKPEMASTESPEKWVHWCVDATKTRLYEICVEAQTGAKRGNEFINELVISYHRLRGIRRWFSLTDCATVKVVKFIRLLDEKDFVRCGSEKVKLDEIRRTLEYDISTDENVPDEDLHIAWVESTLGHYMIHHRNDIADGNIDDVISGLSKKTKAYIGKKARSVGYGIRSVQGWSLAKFLVMLATCTGSGLTFFVYWLLKHPGDIQNASVPYFMLMAAIGAFIALPDLYMN